MKHTSEVLISLHCVYRDRKVTNLWPYRPCFRGFPPVVFGVPSLPRLCGRICTCGTGLTGISLPQLCGENHRKIPCAGKGLNGSVSTAGDVSHIHIMPCPFSVTPFAVLKPLPRLIRLWQFLLPLSCCLHAHIRPSSTIFIYHILCPSILSQTALRIFFFLLFYTSFFLSPPIILWTSLVLEDMMSSEVFMFVLRVEIYKQVSWGNAGCHCSRTGARMLLCLRCEITYKTKSLQKITWKGGLWFAGLNLRAGRCREERTYPAFTSRSRIVLTSGHNKLPPHSNNASQLHQLRVSSTLSPNSPTCFSVSLQVRCPACPKSRAELEAAEV